MAQHDDFKLSWAVGSDRNFARATNKFGTYAQLKDLVRQPLVTGENRRAFDRMSKAERGKLKSKAGWISGAQCESVWRNERIIKLRDLATIDVNYAGPALPMRVQQGVFGMSDYKFLCHSSRRHTPEDPRLHFFIPLSRQVSVVEYVAIIRYIGWLMDEEMKLVDPASYRPAQMMLLPTCSKDDEKHFLFHDNDGELFDVDDALEKITKRFGVWTDLNNLPKSGEEDEIRKRADKVEDPLARRCVVGDFCRAYDIAAAIERFVVDWMDLDGRRPERNQLSVGSLQMRAAQPEGVLSLTLTGAALAAFKLKQADDRFNDLHEEIREQIQLWANEPLTQQALKAEYVRLRAAFPDEEEETKSKIMVRRTVFRTSDVAKVFLGQSERCLTTQQLYQQINKALVGASGWTKERKQRRALGKSGTWWTRNDASGMARKLGYEIVEPGDIHDII
ncbi:hypothetical protein [Rhizobium sp. EC-SD404]|uniref:hypothetical protein n=1 Tax=Rhizobium sp. EC-SD404 TaxID=2038389 RepID=UPI001259A179|nr:hypothetical protein [Rhizobium sp. EC-SD404]VVT31391.1 hypothetical protein RHIZ404_230284 [Rhizobium sp. EC-SD404]